MERKKEGGQGGGGGRCQWKEKKIQGWTLEEGGVVSGRAEGKLRWPSRRNRRRIRNYIVEADTRVRVEIDPANSRMEAVTATAASGESSEVKGPWVQQQVK